MYGASLVRSRARVEGRGRPLKEVVPSIQMMASTTSPADKKNFQTSSSSVRVWEVWGGLQTTFGVICP